MAFRGSALGSSATGGNVTATPTGVAVDDYLCGVLVDDDAAATVTVPTNWTQRVNNDQVNPNGQEMRYADKIAVGSDNFTWNCSTSAPTYVINVALSGRNTSAPRTAVTGEQNTSLNASPITVSHTGVTAAQGDDVLVFMQLDQDAGANDWNFSQITNYTERHDDTTLDWITIAMDSRDNVNAGATGTLSSTATRTVGVTNSGWGVIVASIAAAAGGVTTEYVGPIYEQGFGKMVGRRYV